MPLPEMRMGMAKAVSIAESLEIQKTASNRMKEALAKQAADRLSKSETTTDGTGYSNISLGVDTHDSIDWDTLLSFSGLFIPLLQEIEKVVNLSGHICRLNCQNFAMKFRYERNPSQNLRLCSSTAEWDTGATRIRQSWTVTMTRSWRARMASNINDNGAAKSLGSFNKTGDN